MDELASRLREDAAEISAPVDTALAKRIDAALAAAVRDDAPRQQPSRPVWWASVLAGAAVAAAAILLLNVRTEQRLAEPAETPPTARIVPAAVDRPDVALPLRTRSAVLTDPLEEELEHLKSDFRRAREEVAADLGGSL